MHKLKLLPALIFFAFSTIVGQPDDINNKFMLGQSFEQAGDFEKAKVYYELVFQAEPNNPVFFQSLYNCYLKLKEYELALKCVQQVMKLRPNDVSLTGMLGSVYYLKGDEKQTFLIWESFLSKNKNPQYYRSLAAYAIELRVYDKAIEFLEEGKKLSAEKKSFIYELSNLYTLKLMFTSAAEEYLELLEIDPLQVSQVELRLNSYIFRDDALLSTIKVFEASDNPNNAIKYILAFLYTENSEYGKAFELIKDIDNSQKKSGADLFVFGQKLYNRNQFQFAAEVFRYIYDLYSASQIGAAARIYYCRAEEAKIDDIYKDSSSLWKPITIPKIFPLKKYKRIIELYDEIEQKSPYTESAVEAIYRKGSIYLKTGNYTVATDELKKVVTLFPLSRFYIDALKAFRELYIINGQIDSAIYYNNLLSEAVYSSPSDKNEALYFNALFTMLKNNFTTAKKLFSQLSMKGDDDKTNDAISYTLLLNTAGFDSSGLAGYVEILKLIFRGDLTKALTDVQKVEVHPQNFYLKSEIELKTIEILIALNKYPEALAFCDGIIKEKSNIFKDKIYFYSCRVVNFGMKNSREAKKMYETFLIDYPSSIYSEQVREELQKLMEETVNKTI